MSSISVSHRLFLRISADIIKYVGRESLPGFFLPSANDIFHSPSLQHGLSLRGIKRPCNNKISVLIISNAITPLVKINIGTASAENRPSCSPTLRCKAVVASAEIPNEKLQNDALNGCFKYQGISLNIKISCNKP